MELASSGEDEAEKSELGQSRRVALNTVVAVRVCLDDDYDDDDDVDADDGRMFEGREEEEEEEEGE